MGWIADLLKEIPSAARYKSELEAMENKVKELDAENKKLRQEIKRRDDIIQQEKSHGDHLDEVQEKILILLSRHEELEEEQISRELHISIQLAKFHLEELDDADLAMPRFSAYGMPTWGIIQKGRAYLVHHGLLS